MKTTFLISFIIIIVLFSSLSSYAESYHIGVSLPLSGEKEETGKSILNALKLYVDNINLTGGINGNHIELVVKDDKNDGNTGKAVASEFVQDNRVLAVIGNYDFRVAMPCLETYDKGGLVIFSPSVGNELFVNKSPWTFSGTYNDLLQAEQIAAYLKIFLNAKKVVVIHDDGNSNLSAMKAFVNKANNVNIESISISFNDKSDKIPDDFIGLNKEYFKDIDAIVIFAQSNMGSQVIKQIRDNSITSPIYGGVRLSIDLLKMLGEKYSYDINISFPFMYEFASLETNNFYRQYLKLYNSEPSIWSAIAYDNLKMIIQAINNKGADRKAIRDYLNSITSDENAIKGISGKLFFDEYGAMKRSLTMSHLYNGKFKPAFDQIKVVTENSTLRNLDDKIKADEVIVVDKVPFYKIKCVYVGVDFNRINKVNVKDQNFDIELFLWFKWSGEVDVENIDFTNVMFGKDYQKQELKKATVGGTKWISYKVRGTFLYPYDLRDFPFDIQNLPLNISHKYKNSNRIQLIADKDLISNYNIKEIYPQEWVYLSRDDYSGVYKVSSNFGNPEIYKGEEQADYSIYQSEIIIERILAPYLVTLFLPLFIIIVVSVLIIFIPRDQFAVRMNIIMTSLLSMLVYHMATQGKIPIVGYVVKADEYFMVSYVFLLAIIAKNVWVNIFVSKGNAVLGAKLDKLFEYFYIPSAIIVYALITLRVF